jgi:hypothetical protein
MWSGLSPQGHDRRVPHGTGAARNALDKPILEWFSSALRTAENRCGSSRRPWTGSSSRPTPQTPAKHAEPARTSPEALLLGSPASSPVDGVMYCLLRYVVTLKLLNQQQHVVMLVVIGP